MNNYDDLCKCGHAFRNHGLDGSNCAPGYPGCKCEKFVHFEETEIYGKDHREDGLKALTQLNQTDKSDCCIQAIDNAYSLVAEF